jgi:hypothetical protein
VLRIFPPIVVACDARLFLSLLIYGLTRIWMQMVISPSGGTHCFVFTCFRGTVSWDKFLFLAWMSTDETFQTKLLNLHTYLGHQFKSSSSKNIISVLCNQCQWHRQTISNHLQTGRNGF